MQRDTLSMWPLYLVGKLDLKQNQLVTRNNVLVNVGQSAEDGFLHSGVIAGRQGAQHGRLYILDKGRKVRWLINIIWFKNVRQLLLFLTSFF